MGDPQEEEIYCSLIQNSEAESADDFTTQCFCFNSVLYEAVHNPPIASSQKAQKNGTSTAMHSGYQPHTVSSPGHIWKRSENVLFLYLITTFICAPAVFFLEIFFFF